MMKTAAHEIEKYSPDGYDAEDAYRREESTLMSDIRK